MPVPEKRTGETKDSFLQRCMGDKTMITEFPDIKQRYSVCISKSKK
jgi:hypothetical protein